MDPHAGLAGDQDGTEACKSLPGLDTVCRQRMPGLQQCNEAIAHQRLEREEAVFLQQQPEADFGLAAAHTLGKSGGLRFLEDQLYVGVSFRETRQDRRQHAASHGRHEGEIERTLARVTEVRGAAAGLVQLLQRVTGALQHLATRLGEFDPARVVRRKSAMPNSSSSWRIRRE